jgi:hypothetical protein
MTISRYSVVPRMRDRAGRLRSSFASSRIKVESIGADILILAIGLTCTFTVHMIGELPVSEILIVVALPVLLVTNTKSLFRPRMLTIYSLLVLWLLNLVITDIWRSTATADWTRGDANLIFFAIDLLALSTLISGNQRRQIIFIAAYGVGALLSARFQPSEASIDEPWKFGYATGTNILIALFACYFFSRRNYLVTGALMGGIIAVNLLENFRGPVLNTLVAIALILPVIPQHVGRLTILPRKGSLANVVVLIGLAAVAATAADVLVHFVTQRGLLKDEALQKNQTQSQFAGGIVLGGRPEILVSSKAVLESPILGHGSWARDFKYIEMLADIQAEWGVRTDLDFQEEYSQGLIPTHSHLMGAWVQAGILGAVFWLYMFWLVGKGLIRLSALRPSLSPVFAVMLTAFLFDILFSPFASTRRMTEAFLITILLDMIQTNPARSVSNRFAWRRQPVRVLRALPVARTSWRSACSPALNSIESPR